MHVRNICHRYLHYIITLLGSLCFIAGVFYFERQSRNQEESLIVLTCSDSVPFSFYNKYELTGFDIELIQEISQRINRKIRLYDLPFYLIMDKLRLFHHPSVDLAITAITTTDQRRKFMDLSIPYHTSSTVLLVNKNSGILSEMDLSNKTIAIRTGSVHETFVQKNWIPFIGRMQLHKFDTLSYDIMQKLETNEVQAILLDNEEAFLQIALHKNFKIIPIHQSESHFCIALPKGSFLTPKVNKAICDLQNEGFLRKLEKKWLSQESFIQNSIFLSHKQPSGE